MKMKKEKIPHYFSIQTKNDKDKVLAKLRNEKFTKGKFIIEDMKIFRYLAGVLEGDPEELINRELVRPLSNLPLAEDGLLEYGYQYIVPEIFEGDIKGFKLKNIKRIPEWLYSISLISNDYKYELFLYFWSHQILSEEKLQKYIDNNANISLARMYQV